MEINKDNWKQIDLNVDSLWLIPERERQGKHKNIYHGNFVPQLLKRLRMPEIPCWSCSQAAGLPCSHMKTCAKITSDSPPPKKLSIMSIALCANGLRSTTQSRVSMSPIDSRFPRRSQHSWAKGTERRSIL